jgi:hypothetical protein
MSKKLYYERLERIRKAVALEEVDKMPFAPSGNACWAGIKGVPLKDYITDFKLQCDINLELLNGLNPDASQGTLFSPYVLPGCWLCPVAVPGKELGDNELWQLMESEIMKIDDYDAILDMGFDAWHKKYVYERLDDNESKLKDFNEYLPIANKRYKDDGILNFCEMMMVTPFEYFCGGRSLTCFFMDLIQIPDLVEKVFKVTEEAMLLKYRGIMEKSKPLAVWIGGWRTSPDMMSPQMWEQFVWPYLKSYGELCVEMGVIPIFHLDSNWDRGLEYFRELPPKKCIMSLDSTTDIRKAKEIVGDMMCIMGDVPAYMTAFGTYEEVYEHTMKLIDDIGPTGYIVSSGCDIPANAKMETVQAIADAANNYLKIRNGI